METEPTRRGPKKIRCVHPIRLGWFARHAYASDADDSGTIHIEQNDVPIQATKPISDSEQAKLLNKQPKKRSRWGTEIINIDTY